MSLKHLAGRQKLPPAQRFWRSFVLAETGCWIWQGRGRGSNGYGALSVDGKPMPAHRFIWTLFNGPIPKGMMVCHKCDTPKCVNPHHLFLGTATDNVRDCIDKGRFKSGGAMNPPRGTAHPLSKLTDEDVREIRSDDRNNSAIGRHYGVSKTLIGYIKQRKAWRHVQ